MKSNNFTAIFCCMSLKVSKLGQVRIWQRKGGGALGPPAPQPLIFEAQLFAATASPMSAKSPLPPLHKSWIRTCRAYSVLNFCPLIPCPWRLAVWPAPEQHNPCRNPQWPADVTMAPTPSPNTNKLTLIPFIPTLVEGDHKIRSLPPRACRYKD